jgi:16S rRNA (cytosine1402-N4)-methyltransferase
VHKPVLLNEVIEYLQPQNGLTYVDATFGAGGYAAAILDSAKCNVIAFDRDDTTAPQVKKFTEKFGKRFRFVQDEFARIDQHLTEPVDGFIFDIGVSSMQIDQAERGFSFMQDGPLDMRMNRQDSLTAEFLVNSLSEKDLADLIYKYGDERKSRLIAKRIVEKRAEEPITTTAVLAGIIRSAIGRHKDGIDPSTRTFQALRIAINDELNQLELGLKAAASLLKKDGRLIAVMFHSGEDKIVKEFFNKLCGKVSGINRHMPYHENQVAVPEFKYLHKGTVIASKEELDENPRARSAKLRAIIKVQ